jgi:cell wall-active antibiotic response 4TMS protein YvqF
MLSAMNEPARDRMLEPPPETVTALFSATARRGEWLPPEDMRVRAFFGSVQLDFTQALLAPGVTVIEALALFGAVEITVPPDLEVELAANAVLGSVEQRDQGGRVRRFIADQLRRVTGQSDSREPRHEDDEDRPLLRIEGHAVFGAIVVKVR